MKKTHIARLALFASLALTVASTQSASARVYSPEKRSYSSKHYTPPRVVVPPARVKYTRPTPVVRGVRTLPHTATLIKKGNAHYYYNNGRYYRHDGGRYIIATPPLGIRVRALPIGYTTLRVLNRLYYYHSGTYYTQARGYYEVVRAPQDVIVKTLPEEADHVIIDGKNYYIYNGDVYSIVNTPYGRAFKLTGQLGR